MWKYSRHEMQLQHKTTMLYDTPGSEKESLKSMNKLCFSFPESHSEYYCTYFMCCAFLCCSHNNFKSLIKKNLKFKLIFKILHSLLRIINKGFTIKSQTAKLLCDFKCK